MTPPLSSLALQGYEEGRVARAAAQPIWFFKSNPRFRVLWLDAALPVLQVRVRACMQGGGR